MTAVQLMADGTSFESGERMEEVELDGERMEQGEAWEVGETGGYFLCQIQRSVLGFQANKLVQDQGCSWWRLGFPQGKE